MDKWLGKTTLGWKNKQTSKTNSMAHTHICTYVSTYIHSNSSFSLTKQTHISTPTFSLYLDVDPITPINYFINVYLIWHLHTKMNMKSKNCSLKNAKCQDSFLGDKNLADYLTCFFPNAFIQVKRSSWQLSKWDTKVCIIHEIYIIDFLLITIQLVI